MFKKCKKPYLFACIFLQFLFVNKINSQEAPKFKSVSSIIFDAVNPEVLYKKNERLIIKQIVYSNFEFIGNKYIINFDGLEFVYCDFLNKEGFKYKYILCTEVDLNSQDSFEYILKEDNKNVDFEKILFFEVGENNNLFFNY